MRCCTAKVPKHAIALSSSSNNSSRIDGPRQYNAGRQANGRELHRQYGPGLSYTAPQRMRAGLARSPGCRKYVCVWRALCPLAQHHAKLFLINVSRTVYVQFARAERLRSRTRANCADQCTERRQGTFEVRAAAENC